MSRERFTEHLYQMEKSSFLLDIIRAHACVILNTYGNSGSMLDACLILGGVSPQYCDFILKMRERFPDYDLEMLSQEIYDRIFSLDYKSTARFQTFFEDYLTRWNILRNKERQLRDGLLDRDEAIANFKHAYFVNFNTDVDVIEILSRDGKEDEQENETDQETGEPSGGLTHEQRILSRIRSIYAGRQVSMEFAAKTCGIPVEEFEGYFNQYIGRLYFSLKESEWFILKEWEFLVLAGYMKKEEVAKRFLGDGAQENIEKVEKWIESKGGINKEIDWRDMRVIRVKQKKEEGIENDG